MNVEAEVYHAFRRHCAQLGVNQRQPDKPKKLRHAEEGDRKKSLEHLIPEFGRGGFDAHLPNLDFRMIRATNKSAYEHPKFEHEHIDSALGRERARVCPSSFLVGWSRNARRSPIHRGGGCISNKHEDHTNYQCNTSSIQKFCPRTSQLPQRQLRRPEPQQCDPYLLASIRDE